MTNSKRKEIVQSSVKIAHDIVATHTNSNYTFDINSQDIEQVFNFYETLKDEIKAKISSINFNQDRHKIASVVYMSILWFHPISVTKCPGSLKKIEAESWINKLFAFAVAENIIFSFLNDDESVLLLPQTTGTGKAYIDYLFGLVDAMIQNTQFDKPGEEIAKKTNYITSLSNIFYLLERYTLDFR